MQGSSVRGAETFFSKAEIVMIFAALVYGAHTVGAAFALVVGVTDTNSYAFLGGLGIASVLVGTVAWMRHNSTEPVGVRVGVAAIAMLMTFPAVGWLTYAWLQSAELALWLAALPVAVFGLMWQVSVWKTPVIISRD